MKQNMIQLEFLRDHRRVLLAAGSIVVGISLVLIMNAIQTKDITFVHSGKVYAMSTKAETIGEFLDEKGISPGVFDEVKPEPTGKLTEGAQVVYTPRQKITLAIGGEQRQAITLKGKVQDILREQKIELGPLDETVPALDQEIGQNEKIVVTRVEKKIIQQEKTIAFNTQQKSEHTMLAGEKKVVQEGQPGKVMERYEVLYRNGKEISKKLVDSNVLQNSKDQIVALGTGRMVAVSRSAVSTRRASMLAEGNGGFTPRQVLRMKMTAYSADFASTGKSPGHPDYAKTRTGTTAAEGRTIAVDPDVVPLGWWVYIEGYGFRKAEDTGGAIKGNRVDLFFNSEDEATNFGVQQKTVYVIGPNKPE
ncbi:3D domain-containing protein [Aneurinibacillus tyrosinisolvens]|uniref:3D domain-containing protein n=1 Tax=Aneurinibacillus tyrosinisolvens TaxID=1443435 RepID=UPI000699D028|nr:3D domain-containing protein [Aneurinibacillus tyrosinisolvens]